MYVGLAQPNPALTGHSPGTKAALRQWDAAKTRCPGRFEPVRNLSSGPCPVVRAPCPPLSLLPQHILNFINPR